LHIGKTNQHYSYFFNGRQINDACVVSDLGIEIDSSLKYDAHINKIVGKAYFWIGVLFKAFTTRHVPVLKQAFLTYVRPVLEYASNVWAPYLIKHINALEKVQKHFTKRIPSSANLSYPERLAALDLEPLELRRLVLITSAYTIVLHFRAASILQSNFTSQTRTGGNRLIRPLCSTKRYENDFFNRCVSYWIFLPYTVVNASSISCFKRFFI